MQLSKWICRFREMVSKLWLAVRVIWNSLPKYAYLFIYKFVYPTIPICYVHSKYKGISKVSWTKMSSSSLKPTRLSLYFCIACTPLSGSVVWRVHIVTIISLHHVTTLRPIAANSTIHWDGDLCCWSIWASWVVLLASKLPPTSASLPWLQFISIRLLTSEPP